MYKFYGIKASLTYAAMSEKKEEKRYSLSSHHCMENPWKDHSPPPSPLSLKKTTNKREISKKITTHRASASSLCKTAGNLKVHCYNLSWKSRPETPKSKIDGNFRGKSEGISSNNWGFMGEGWLWFCSRDFSVQGRKGEGRLFLTLLTWILLIIGCY